MGHCNLEAISYVPIFVHLTSRGRSGIESSCPLLFTIHNRPAHGFSPTLALMYYFLSPKFLCVSLMRRAKKLSTLIRYSAEAYKGFQIRNLFERRVAVTTCKIDLSDSKPRIAYNKGQPREPRLILNPIQCVVNSLGFLFSLVGYISFRLVDSSPSAYTYIHNGVNFNLITHYDCQVLF